MYLFNLILCFISYFNLILCFISYFNLILYFNFILYFKMNDDEEIQDDEIISDIYNLSYKSLNKFKIIINKLLNNKFDINYNDLNQNTLFSYILLNNDNDINIKLEKIKFILEKGAKININCKFFKYEYLKIISKIKNCNIDDVLHMYNYKSGKYINLLINYIKLIKVHYTFFCFRNKKDMKDRLNNLMLLYNVIQLLFKYNILLSLDINNIIYDVINKIKNYKLHTNDYNSTFFYIDKMNDIVIFQTVSISILRSIHIFINKCNKNKYDNLQNMGLMYNNINIGKIINNVLSKYDVNDLNNVTDKLDINNKHNKFMNKVKELNLDPHEAIDILLSHINQTFKKSL
jgi:hypothetical protein